MAVNPKRTAGRPRRGNVALDLDRIIDQAWAVVDTDGFSGLSTRSLAAALDVQSPALYWHVKSKEQLLSLMMEHLLQDSLDHISRNLHWTDWLREVGRGQRHLLLSHRDSGMIAMLAPPTERLRTELFPKMFQPLMAAGLPPESASAAAGALAGLVLGWVIYEQRPETRAFVESFHSSNEAFEFALDAFVTGLAAKMPDAEA